MESVFLIKSDGSIKYAYNRDGTEPKMNVQQLYAAAHRLSSICDSPTSILSPSGKQISFLPGKEDEMLIYVSDVSYHTFALTCLLKSQYLMTQAFYGSFLRPIHVDGVRLNNIFKVPRVYPHEESTSIRNLLNELTSAVSSPLCAIYAKNMITVATDEYWKIGARDLHAIDLLVRYNEAPFTDQIFQRENGRTDRVIVFHVWKTLKFICINGPGFNAMNAASTTLPTILWKNSELLKQMESAPPIVDKQEGLVAWVIVDVATPRFFGNVPQELERQFINLVCKALEIGDTNRITDISLRLEEYKFFYMPKVFIKKSFFYNQPHMWDFFCLHSLKKNEAEMRKFAMDTMLSLFQYVKPVNPVNVSGKGEAK